MDRRLLGATAPAARHAEPVAQADRATGPKADAWAAEIASKMGEQFAVAAATALLSGELAAIGGEVNAGVAIG